MNRYVLAGDCTNELPKLADKSIDVIITDPPYDSHATYAQRKGTARIVEDPFRRPQFNRMRHVGFEPLTDETMKTCAQEFARLVKRWVLIFCTFEMVDDWRVELLKAKLEYVRCGIWVKKNSTPQFSGDRPATGAEAIVIAHPKGKKRWNGGGTHGVWTYPIVQGKKIPRLHPTQKPIGLMRELVDLFSEPGELILDCFAGSGGTGVAALESQRRFIGYEKNAAMADIAEKRILDSINARDTLEPCSMLLPSSTR